MSISARLKSLLSPGRSRPALENLLCLEDFEAAASALLSPAAFEYARAGAADEITVALNCAAFRRVLLRPRVLVDVSRLDTSINLLGCQLPFPVLLAPVSRQRLFHEEGELATVRAAGAKGAVAIVSTPANYSLEEIARAATAPLWFQLYAQRDREFTRELVEHAEAAGYRAICVTVDTPVAGVRNREARTRVTLSPALECPNLRGLRTMPADNIRGIYSAELNPALVWEDVAWLRSITSLPLLLKGILDPADAAHALEAGVAGVIVSNHGGRNLDTLPASIQALPSVAEVIGGRIPVLLDGGVRRGTDVLKAIALGASAVLIGRPYVYGLGIAGAQGVARVLEILHRELLMAMALTGRCSIGEIDRSVLWEPSC